jgi:hypothetical protein
VRPSDDDGPEERRCCDWLSPAEDSRSRVGSTGVAPPLLTACWARLCFLFAWIHTFFKAAVRAWSTTGKNTKARSNKKKAYQNPIHTSTRCMMQLAYV